MTREAARAHGIIAFGEAVRVWARIAALSFGGPAGQIAVMHRILVEEKRWIGEERFLHALNFCMLLPGPEAQQLAIYIGWLLHRTRGGLVAGILFVLPGMVAIMALSCLYAAYGHLAAVEALFFGLKAAVLAIVVEAVRRIGARALKRPAHRMVAATAFAGIFFFGVPFPLIVLAAGLTGWVASRAGADAFAAVGGGHGSSGAAPVADAETALGENIPDHARPNVGWSLRIGAVFLLLWFVPILVVAATFPGSVFPRIGIFFSQMAVVTFGGAYAVLAYVAQQAVEKFGWLAPGEMLDGLGMAETTPGPLIMVTQFVGFMAAYRHPGALPPMAAGVVGGLLTTWVTFTPCFLWIFLGAPFVERLRGNVALSAALSAITAAVVGVVFNLALWFALHTWFRTLHPLRFGWMRADVPLVTSADVPAILLSAAAMLAIFRFRASTLKVLAGCAVAGILYRALV